MTTETSPVVWVHRNGRLTTEPDDQYLLDSALALCPIPTVALVALIGWILGPSLGMVLFTVAAIGLAAFLSVDAYAHLSSPDGTATWYGPAPERLDAFNELLASGDPVARAVSNELHQGKITLASERLLRTGAEELR